VSPDREEYLDDDDRGRFSPRSILASGWFRALLVLGALAVMLVIAVPYLLRWFDGAPPEPRPQARITAPPAPVPAAPPPPAPAAPAASPPAAMPGAARKTELIQPVPPPERQPGAPTRRAEAPTPAPREAAPRSRPRPEGAEPKAADAPREASRPAAAAAGSYWVQVGAFQDARNAERLAVSLRSRKLQVQVAQVTRVQSAAARHEVVVSGASVEAVSAALGGSGTAQQTGAVVVVRPPLELREAVALSRRLAGDGLSVKIRRAGDGAPATYHIVRVGGYPSRAAAEAGRREVEGHGLATFITQGAPR